ncbi:diacylglycerol kinase family lipid kinase [Roseomonas stagni]|uniref:Diacylglycerol kinase family lipid kinase n=1 Tax=Falsiroseomonas algicola TaxID=2716930 RepID=A0A6M1LVA6_9PROT|nr:diacylglycerol kinase family protein [Falsiroseomonas algicola]NGM24117.1 diacylglycerol kinase family lipid kinase [Falsiroseomonas algicola]
MLVIFNPAAGAGRRRRLSRAIDWLCREGLPPDVAETRAPGDARLIAADAASRGESVIVAAGGDGTIAEVAAGIAGSAATLGILPLGTANVLALELGVPLAPEQAAAVLAAGTRRLIHPGLITDEAGTQRLFVQMAGAGFDAAVVQGLDLGLKRRLGRAAYVIQAMREVARHPFAPIEAVLDGTRHRAGSVIVTKGRLYAGRHLLAPAARPAAPGFQVALLDAGGPGAVVAAALALPLGLLPRLPGMRLLPASRVTLSGPGVALQADGDPAGCLPARIEDAPAPLPILLP